MLRLLTALVCLILPSCILGFDTGHHFDATRNSLLLRGFNPAADSINIAQLQNYAADWNALAVYIKYPNFRNIKDKCNLLHFNSLYNSTMVRKYWIQLWNNTYHTTRAILENRVKIGTQKSIFNVTDKPLLTVQQSNSKTNPLQQKEFLLLSVMGMILHAQQDFYTHSNWITAQRKDTSSSSTPVVSSGEKENSGTSQFANVDNSNEDDCYYPQGSYNPLLENEYNLHTYFYPETKSEEDRVRDQWNYTDLIKHGGYYDGINKDSYTKENFDYSYVNAVMQSIDLVDTFKLWITTIDKEHGSQIWKNMQNYTLTRQQDKNNLHFGTAKLFSVSAYLELAWWQADSNSGHWKGKGSGDTSSTISEASFALSDFHTEGVYQQVVWNTDILDMLVYHIEKIDRQDILPMFAEEMIPKIMPQRVVNDPANFKAIIVRTHEVGAFEKGSNWEGMYAVIGIEGQFFRETPMYATTTFPWWQSIRIIERNINKISISYDLAIWTSDLEDEDRLTVVSPYAYIFQPFINFYQTVVNWFKSSSTSTSTSTSTASQMTGEKLTHMYEQSKVDGTTQYRLRSKFKTEELNLDRFAISLSGAESEEIEADIIVNKTGVFFLYDSEKGMIVSGLPNRFLNKRVDAWPEHQLVLSALSNSSSSPSAAFINVTIHTRYLCKATYVTGTLGFAPAANTTYNLLFPQLASGPVTNVSAAVNEKAVSVLFTYVFVMIMMMFVHMRMR